MTTAQYEAIVDTDGITGIVDSQALHNGDMVVRVTLQTGQQLLLPTNLLKLSEGSPYHLNTRWADLFPLHTAPTAVHQVVDGVVIPLTKEAVQVEKRWVETGRVHLRKVTHEEELLIEETLKRQEVTVERLPKNEVITEIPTVRYEDNTMIIPIVEEVLVIEKRLVLKEELRVTRQEVETPWQQMVVLHKDEVTVERTPTTQRMDTKSP